MAEGVKQASKTTSTEATYEANSNEGDWENGAETTQKAHGIRKLVKPQKAPRFRYNNWRRWPNSWKQYYNDC